MDEATSEPLEQPQESQAQTNLPQEDNSSQEPVQPLPNGEMKEEEESNEDEAGIARDDRQQEPLEKSALEENKPSLDNLQVAVDFQIGSITLPVNELASLAVGWTLTDLPNITFPKVLALSAGRPFAEGELVEIDGKLGFRITKILP